MVPSSEDLGLRVVPIWSYDKNVLNLRTFSMLPQKKNLLYTSVL